MDYILFDIYKLALVYISILIFLDCSIQVDQRK